MKNKKAIWENKRFVFAMAVLCCTLWSSAAPFIKTGYALFQIKDTASILVFAGMRFTLAGILVLLIQRMIHPDMHIQVHFKYVLILALCQTFGQYFLYYIGLAHTSGVATSVIIGMSTFFTLLFSVYVFKNETMTKNKLLGVVLGFTGILIMNVGGNMTGSVFGNGLILMSQICSSLSSCFINRFTQVDDPVSLSGTQFCMGGIGLVMAGLFMGGHFPTGSWTGNLVLMYLACLSAIAYTIWGLLLAYNPVSKITIFNSLIPILGVFLSAIILHESKQAFMLQTWAALILVSVGIYIVLGTKQKSQ